MSNSKGATWLLRRAIISTPTSAIIEPIAICASTESPVIRIPRTIVKIGVINIQINGTLIPIRERILRVDHTMNTLTSVHHRLNSPGMMKDANYQLATMKMPLRVQLGMMIL